MTASETTEEAVEQRSVVALAARAASSFYAIVALAFALFVAWHANRFHYTVPYLDDWRILDDMFSSSIPEWILAPQNGHRVPVTLSLLFLDYSYFGGHMNLLVTASIACTGIGVAAMLRSLRSEGASLHPATIAWVAFACFLLCWAASRHDLVWGMNQGTLMAAMWCIVCMSSIGTVVHRIQQDERPAWLPLLAAPLAATAATFSQGIGFSCWAGLLAVGLVARLPARIVVGYAVGAACVLAFYLNGIEIPVYDSPETYPILLSRKPFVLLEFAITWMGAPAATLFPTGTTDNPRGVATIMGTLGVVVFGAFAVFTWLRRACTTAFHAFAIGLPSTSFAGGMMVALNRHFWPEHATDLRFSTGSTLFWIGLAFVIPAICSRARSKPGWTTLIGSALLLLISAQLFANLRSSHIEQDAIHSRLHYVNSMHLLDIRWDLWAGTTIQPLPERTYRVVDRLRHDRRSFFEERRAWYSGSSISKDFTQVDDSRCAGAVTTSKFAAARDGRIALVGGWVESRDVDMKIDQILIADRSASVQGLGMIVHRDAKLARTELPPENDPWAGFLKLQESNTVHRVYALFDDGVSVCDLKVKRNVFR